MIVGSGREEQDASPKGLDALEEMAPGSVVAARYEVRRPVRRGGMGMVYVAHDLMLARDVALKVCLREDRGPGNQVRFANEARAAARIRSLHVVTVHDIGALRSGVPFLVMELLDG